MKLENLAKALKDNPFTAPLTDAQRTFLAGCAKNVRFAVDEYLFREGEPANELFLVREGRAALESHLPQRGAVTVESLGAGEVLGWSALFPPHRWHLSARAMESCRAFSIDAECLRNKLSQDDAFAYQLTRLLLFQLHKRLERARLQQLDVYRAEL